MINTLGNYLLVQRRAGPPPNHQLAARINLAIREADSAATRLRMLRIKTGLSLAEAVEKFQVERAWLRKPETALDIVNAARILFTLGRRKEAGRLARTALADAQNNNLIYTSSLVM